MSARSLEDTVAVWERHRWVHFTRSKGVLERQATQVEGQSSTGATAGMVAVKSTPTDVDKRIFGSVITVGCKLGHHTWLHGRSVRRSKSTVSSCDSADDLIRAGSSRDFKHRRCVAKGGKAHSTVHPFAA